MAQTIYKETDGQSVDVSLIYTVTGDRPILVDGILYFPTPYGRVIALDPVTGAEHCGPMQT